MSTPICDFVRDYCNSVAIRLHMPGHKGFGSWAARRWISPRSPARTTSPARRASYSPARRTQRSSSASAHLLFAPAAAHSASRRCSTSRTSSALMARGTASRCPERTQELLHGCALLGPRARVAPPRRTLPLPCPAALESSPDEGERPFAVYITSPDYLGGVQDTASLAEVCHARGLPLLVDNAHGAYLKFLPSRHPLDWARTCAATRRTRPCLC